MQPLHKYHDNSVLGTISVRALLAIPIWKGNRIIDMAHVRRIQESVKDVRCLDSGYKIICYSEEDVAGRPVEQRYIVDGQHRLSVLRDYYTTNLCEADFQCTATEVAVADEAAAIAYFNAINNTKPIHFKEDPTLIVNRYIQAFAATFVPVKRQALLRSTATHRPYLHVDRLREALLAVVDRLPAVDRWTTKIREKNAAIVRELELLLACGGLIREKSIVERAVELGFGLAVDGKLRWVADTL